MEETLQLIQASQAGDMAARERVVTMNMGLVYQVVKRFSGRGYETEDLIQLGSIGLLKAIEKFDFTYEVKFSTYAVPMIIGEIKRFLRDDGMIKVSRSLKELAVRAYQAKALFLEKENREPTLEELAEELQVDQEELLLAMEAGNSVESLHQPVYQKDGSAILLMDKIEDTNDCEKAVLNHMVLQQMFQELSPEEQRLIHLRYFADKTQSAVGKELGISQVQVSRMEKKILEQLRMKFRS
jgi:RNA polymerase sporulation-specific sigma factor